jgi:hypothetical protein
MPIHSHVAGILCYWIWLKTKDKSLNKWSRIVIYAYSFSCSRLHMLLKKRSYAYKFLSSRLGGEPLKLGKPYNANRVPNKKYWLKDIIGGWQCVHWEHKAGPLLEAELKSAAPKDPLIGEPAVVTSDPRKHDLKCRYGLFDVNLPWLICQLWFRCYSTQTCVCIYSFWIVPMNCC